MKSKRYYVERFVLIEHGEKQSETLELTSPKSLAEYQNVARYVLLGEPGAGKTTAFQHEAEKLGDETKVVPARLFIEWQHNAFEDKTLFIDGLDEVIANAGNRTPLSEVRKQLRRFNIQRYRISCRAADWNGERDVSDFESVNGDVTVLHLQGFSDQDIKTYLIHDPRIKDADNFYKQAENNQLDNFLSNPQSLDMLIEATMGGQKWPNSKQEIYQKACEVLSKENNQEHLESPSSRFITEQLLEAAGELYAYMLIANSQIFKIVEVDESGVISLPQLGIKKEQPHYVALKTRLFNTISNSSFSPIHRSVAEFLAAQYLAKKLKQGLSLRRCFALISGFDGGPVAALRGLYAWLGTLSVEARAKVIETDALGLLQYGDVSAFSVAEKVKVIETLNTEAKNTGYLRYQKGKGFASLTTYEMAQYLKEVLSSRSQIHQTVIDVIISGLFYSEKIPELKQCLVDIFKDTYVDETLRLDALMVMIEKRYVSEQELLEMAEAIKNKKIHDDSFRLQSYLLSHLYPDMIQPGNIFDYAELSESNVRDRQNYWMFWDYKFYDRLNDSHIPALLDALALHNESLTAYRSHDESILKLAGKLLSKGLELYGESISDEKLYHWLSIGFNKGVNRLKDEAKETIQSWMQQHSERFLPLLEIGLSQLQASVNLRYKISSLQRKLYINSSQNLSDWWLKKALQTKDPELSKHCFIEAYWSKSAELGNDNQLLEFFQEWTAKHVQFIEIYERLIFCKLDENASMYAEEKKWKQEHELKRYGQKQKLLKHIDAMREGKAYPAIYESIAVHYGTYYDTENLDEERLKEFLCEDDSLIEAAKQGIRKVIYREDLPEIDDVFRAKARNQPYFICLPFLLSISIHFKESAIFLDCLDITQISLAFAFSYSHNGGEALPQWFEALQSKYPELAANIFIRFMRIMLKAKKPHIHCHAVLGYKKEDYKEKIAQLVAIPLLLEYPVKSLSDNAHCLERLLKTALGDESLCEKLKSIVGEKLARKSMDVLQRVYWLGAGFLINSVQYQQELVAYVSGSDERGAYLADFIYPYSDDMTQRFNLPLNTIKTLIQLLGDISTPRWIGNTRGFRVVTRNMHNGELVHDLIEKLGEDSGCESTEIINDLIANNTLIAWHPTLKKVLQTQKTNRREAEYRHPNLRETQETLGQTRPANVADLSAMVLDYFDLLQREMHTTDTDNYLRFWNEDSYSKPVTPKVENSSRRYLAEKLKDKYASQGIEINSEALAADNKRTDIRLNYRDNEKRLNLPIEIKPNSNDEIWTAIHQQLIAKYTNEPDTQGRGIYLVLWFGVEFNVTAKDGGNRPKNANELQKRLTATMTTEEQKLIDVFVLDVSKPN